MKYLCLVLLSNVIGCGSMKSGPIRDTKSEAPKTMRNEKCFVSQKMKVLQILDSGILGHICPSQFPGFYRNAYDACIMEGDLVYLPVPRNENDYVDEQKVELEQQKCFASDGTFSYLNDGGVRKTIRKIRIADSETPTANVVP